MEVHGSTSQRHVGSGGVTSTTTSSTLLDWWTQTGEGREWRRGPHLMPSVMYLYQETQGVCVCVCVCACVGVRAMCICVCVCLI